jgi:hypothetical protein
MVVTSRACVLPWRLFFLTVKREIAKKKNENTVNGKNLGVRRQQLVFAGFIHLKLETGNVSGKVPDPFWASRIRIRNYSYGSGSFHQQAKSQDNSLFLLFSDFSITNQIQGRVLILTVRTVPVPDYFDLLYDR